MSIAELRKLPPAEKLKIIQTLWEDLLQRESEVESPAWHEERLRQTKADFEAGRIKAVDWEQAKKDLRKRSE